MSTHFEDPVDDLPVWDGQRLRVMIVWDIREDRVHLRFHGESLIATLGLMERAKMMLNMTKRSAENPPAEIAPPTILMFSGPKEPQ